MVNFVNKFNDNVNGTLVNDEKIVLNRAASTTYNLLHHNVITTKSIDIWTGVGKTGTKITDFTITQDAAKPWVYVITFGASVTSGTYYITYYSSGDYADADDINNIQNEIIKLVRKIANVQDFGAVGDGVTDDTQAFNDAINYLKTINGGNLLVPKTDSFYLMVDAAILIDDLNIYSNGAVMKKNGSSSNYYIFKGLSGTNKGYGSGPSNILFDGLRIEGSFADVRGASITLHHSQDITFRNCEFSECVVSGHPIDLGGCSDILVDNCRFYGFLPQVGREYVEAIQLDNSTAEGNGSMDDPASYDGLPCRNVTVQNSSFVPLTIGATTYTAPNPIGIHSRVAGAYTTNIKFLNNYVEDAPVAATTDGAGNAAYCVGWLHFYHIDGLEVSGNTFYNKSGFYARLMGLYTLDTAILLSDVSLAAPTKKAYPSMPCKNVKFNGNTVKGFKHPDSTVNIIYLQGRNYSGNASYPAYYYVENFRMNDNDFIDCFDTTLNGGSSYNISSDVLRADYAKGVYANGNTFNSVKRLANITNCSKIKINGNDFIKAYWNPVNIATSDTVVANDNTFDGCGAGFYMNAVDKLEIHRNTFVNARSEAKASYGDLVQLKTVTKFHVKDNQFDGTSGTLYIGVHTYTTCQNGFVRDNINVNHTPTSIAADSVNVIVS